MKELLIRMLRQIFKIQSPSRVTHEKMLEIGKQAHLGFQAGLAIVDEFYDENKVRRKCPYSRTPDYVQGEDGEITFLGEYADCTPLCMSYVGGKCEKAVKFAGATFYPGAFRKEPRP